MTVDEKPDNVENQAYSLKKRLKFSIVQIFKTL